MPNDAGTAIDRLSASIVSTLWRQWAALGQSAARAPRTIVDIEALLLASEWFAGDEARLSSASAEWRHRVHGLVSMQRLGNIRARFPELEGSSPHAAWTSEFRLREATKPARRDRRTSPVDHAGRPTCTLQLRLRLLLGVGAKADSICLLLGRTTDDALPQWCIEQEVAYGAPALRKVTRDLTWAGTIASSRDGRHGISAIDEWWGILRVQRPERPVWQSWGTIFGWAAAARLVVAQGLARDVTDYALGAQLDALSERLGEPLPWMSPLSASLRIPRQPGTSGFVARCTELEQQLTNDA